MPVRSTSTAPPEATPDAEADDPAPDPPDSPDDAPVAASNAQAKPPAKGGSRAAPHAAETVAAPGPEAAAAPGPEAAAPPAVAVEIEAGTGDGALDRQTAADPAEPPAREAAEAQEPETADAGGGAAEADGGAADAGGGAAGAREAAAPEGEAQIPEALQAFLGRPDRPELVIIAAVAEGNRVIGRGEELPWHLPEDLKRFKQITTGYPILMGRKTFESILHQFGGPLPKRRTVVLTSQGAVAGQDVEAYDGLDGALEALGREDVVFIGGGAAVYEQFLPVADWLELTLVEGAFEGDTFFPPFEHLLGTAFKLVVEERRDGYRFVTYERKERLGAAAG